MGEVVGVRLDSLFSIELWGCISKMLITFRLSLMRFLDLLCIESSRSVRCKPASTVNHNAQKFSP